MLTFFLSLLIQGCNEEGRCVNSAADDGMCRALDFMQQQPSSYRNPACYSNVLRLPLRIESEQPDKESIREGLSVWGEWSLHLAREE